MKMGKSMGKSIGTYVILGAVLMFGCHHSQGDSPSEATTPMVDNTPHPTPGNDGTMIPPDKMDEVQTNLSRRNGIISRCLATAMENKEVPKNTHGRITFEIRIGTNGTAESVKVVKTNLESKSVTDCATKHVQETGFPTLPAPYETSYTYSMEAN
jgi:hypothetical protein